MSLPFFPFLSLSLSDFLQPVCRGIDRTQQPQTTLSVRVEFNENEKFNSIEEDMNTHNWIELYMAIRAKFELTN